MQDFKKRMDEYHKFKTTSGSNKKYPQKSDHVPYKENLDLKCKVWTVLLIIIGIAFVMWILGVR